MKNWLYQKDGIQSYHLQTVYSHLDQLSVFLLSGLLTAKLLILIYLERLAAEKQMLVYIFEPKDIDWEKELIRGTTIHGGEGLYPFPAVIYDRLIIVKNQKDFIDEVRFKLQSVYHIPFINPIKLSILTSNKWDTHKLLAQEFNKFLPDTRLLKQQSDHKRNAGSIWRSIFKTYRRNKKQGNHSDYPQANRNLLDQ